jgi:hypothetical protein
MPSRALWPSGLGFILLCLVLIFGALLCYQLIHFNLPMAANVDERTSLVIFRNLERT